MSAFELTGAIDGLRIGRWWGSLCREVAVPSCARRRAGMRAGLRSSAPRCAKPPSWIRAAGATDVVPAASTAQSCACSLANSNDAFLKKVSLYLSLASSAALAPPHHTHLHKFTTTAHCLHWPVSAHPRPLAASRSSPPSFLVAVHNLNLNHGGSWPKAYA
jgi:hypothetical protein